MKLVLLVTALVARCGALVLPARPVATVGRVLLRSRPIVLEVAPESAAEPQANGLPEGWATATDDEGSTYYWNKVRREPMQARTLQLTHVSCRTPAAALSHTHLCGCAQETKETTWQKPGTAPAKDSAGNVYDDESEQDDGPDFSSAMKQKMINEAGGLGADPNKKNPFLLVFFGIGVFVVAGALSSGML